MRIAFLAMALCWSVSLADDTLPGRLELNTPEDLRSWSQLTGIPIVALSERVEFFRANAHLVAGPVADIGLLRSSYDSKSGTLVIRDGSGRSLPLRKIAVDPIRVLESTAQIKHNRDFAEDSIVLEALAPYLVPLDALSSLDELGAALRALPPSIVQVMRGKAIYLSTKHGQGSEALWHDLGTDKSPGFAGLQPGVFLETRSDGGIEEALARGVGRLVRETVMEGRYFGLYAHPLQFPAFQEANTERRRIFGKRRDRLPVDPTEDFVAHFAAYVVDPLGVPKSERFEFIETLIERTPTTMERLTPRHISRSDPARQRAILNEYRTWQGLREAVVAKIETEFGAPFSEFTDDEYERFMAGLDLNRDEDLWTWSHVTEIPIVGLGQRSNYFHMNAHLLADVEAAHGMPWSELTGLRSSYDRTTGRLQITTKDGRTLPLRELPDDLVRHTASTAGIVHNAEFADDRIVFEALEPALLRLSELENRAELVEGIRLLPLPIVKAHRGKAIYPTDRARTGWAVTWRVGSDRVRSYVGMQSGSFVEVRRDPARADVSPQTLVNEGLGSLKGSSTDSLLHEIGHIIDHAVIGGRSGFASFPHQFPEFQALLTDKNRIFGEGDDAVPQTDHGYVSGYAKANAQENFAEHFWAYLRHREGFLARAREEATRGNVLLMDKFHFMERLVERTPPTGHRLSTRFIEERDRKLQSEHSLRRQEILELYRARFAERDAAVATSRQRFGKPFAELSGDDYETMMRGLDLERDDDLWHWSHVTGITIVGLTQKSTFFYCNAHLMQDIRAAVTMSARELTSLKRGYDPDRNVPTLRTADGGPLELRALPPGTVRPVARNGGLTYEAGFAESRTVLEAIEPYLATFDQIADRKSIVAGLRALPLSVVKAFRGKAIYLTTQPGRSYAVGMPVSNATYTTFAGMQSGFFLDRGSITTHNLVHELGHVIDYTAIADRYGSFLHHYQFPALHELRAEKQRIFGKGDDPVPATDHGYISSYAKSNAQESFAEHFAAFVLDRERFRSLAETEAAGGHPELLDKYRFLEKLVERTPVTTVRLSPAYLGTL